MLKFATLFLSPLLVGSILFSTNAWACTGVDTSMFDGGSALGINTSNPIGASAYIDGENPYVGCVVSTAWVMLASSDAGSQEWAQVGWLKGASNNPYNFPTTPTFFSQWVGQNDASPTTVYYPQYGSPGGSHFYQVNNQNPGGYAGGTIEFAIDGTGVGSVYWNNVFNVYPADSVQYNGEIKDQGDQFPGTSSNPVYFTSVQYESGNTDSWGQPYINSWLVGSSSDGSVTDSTASLYNGGYSANDDFDIWDSGPMAQ